MRLFYKLRIVVLLISSSLVMRSYGQDKSFAELEQRVYQLNNALQYNASQALLLPVLQDETYSADEKYQAAILLSYTYKRVFDYQSTLKFLTIARQFAQQTDHKVQYLATIQSEEAFALFDRQEYGQADRLTAALEKTGFRYISPENRAKLIMQQGYSLFLRKQYEPAARTYDRAIVAIRAAAPCHLPMIYVKQMQLYDALNRPDLLKKALQRSTHSADSCRIIKYHLYAYEELLKIYKKHKDMVGIVQTQQKLDSLNIIYASHENISALHNQREALLLKEDNRKLQQEQSSRKYLTLLMAGFAVVALGLLTWLLIYRRSQRRMVTEFQRIKQEMEAYLAVNQTALTNQPVSEKEYLNKLSERQREVLDCMGKGMSNKAIADKLFISENTVKYHIKNIYLMLEIKDRKELLVSLKK